MLNKYFWVWSLQVLCILGIAYGDTSGYTYHHHAAPHTAPARAVAQHQHHQQQQHHSIPSSQYKKEFYAFTAPEEQFDQSDAIKQQIASTVKKNLNVIIIKPPEDKTYQRALNQIAQNAQEQTKTHIYVLQKEPNFSALANKVRQVQTSTRHSQKPEVNFVKYRTPAEAQHFQNAISAGSVQSNGVQGIEAPSREYLTPKHDAPVANNYAQNFLPSGSDVAPGSSYIPPAF